MPSRRRTQRQTVPPTSLVGTVPVGYPSSSSASKPRPEQDLVEWTTAANTPGGIAELRIQLNAVETFYTTWRAADSMQVSTRAKSVSPG